MKTISSLKCFGIAAAIGGISMGGLITHAANITWTNSANGGWNLPANWNPNIVPGTNDTAVITIGGVSVTLNSATGVGGIILGTNFGGTETLLLNSQALTLYGPLTVNSSGALTVDGGSLLGSNSVLSGTIGWSGGTLGGTMTLGSAGTLNITAGNNHYIGGCLFTNLGTVNWSGDNLYSGAGAVFNNYGLWNAQDDQQLNNYYGGTGVVFNNYGTFRKSGGASEFASATVFPSGVTFNQLAGVIDVQNGTNGLRLVFQNGGSFTGGYITTNQFGLTMLAGGSYNLNGTVTGTNTWETGDLVGTVVIKGALNWQGGSWNNTVATVPASSVLNITAANNHFMGGCVFTNSGTVNWSGCYLYAGGGAVFDNYGLWIAQDDQQLNNYSAGAGTVFNNFGTFRKSGGLAAGNTLIGNPVNFTNTGVVDVQQGNLVLQGNDSFKGGYITTNSTGKTYFDVGNFNLNGTATGSNVIESAGNLVGTNIINAALTWQNGSWSGTVVTVATNGVLNITTANNHYLGGCLLTNSGTVNWSGGGLYAGGGAAIYNYGLWNAQDDQILSDFSGAPHTAFNNFGTFRKSGGTTAGNTVIGNPVNFTNTGIVDVQQGNLVLQGNDSFTGGYLSTNSSGKTYFSSGNFNLNGTVTGNNVIENGGILVGTNVINGALTWQNGSWNNTVVTVATNSVLNVTTANNHYVGGCIVTNFGTVNWSGSWLYAGAGAFFNNYGVWIAQDDQTLSDYYGSPDTAFNNYGTFRKLGGTGTTAFASGVTFNNTGKIDAQNGNIALQGVYTLANGTKMGFGLGGAAGNGSITLPGAAAFIGSGSVNLNGFFWPAAGSSFNLLNYSAESGRLFTNLTLAVPGYITWQTNYNTTAFVLSVLAHIATNTTPTNLFLSTLNSSNIFLQWPGDHTGWSIQAQTNPVTVGIRSNWGTIAGTSLTNQFVEPIDKTNGTVFFRMSYP